MTPSCRQAFLRALLAVLTGTLLFLAAPTHDIWVLAWVGFLPLLLAINGVSPARAFLYGWLAGTVANLGGYTWITLLLIRFGHLSWPATLPLYLLFGLYQGVHWGLLGYGVSYCRTRHPRLPVALVAPVFLVTAELIMPFIFDGYLAITQAWNRPVIQIADLTGPFGISFLILMVNGACFDLWLRRHHGYRRYARIPAAAAGVLLLSLGYGALRIDQVERTRAAAEKVNVGIVQANVGIAEKGRAQLAMQHHQLHLALSRELIARGAELLVWPETAYPYAMAREQERDFPPGDPRQLMQGLTVPLIFGLTTYSPRSRFPWNSAYLMAPDGMITGRFDKNYLLLFGERIPFYEQFPQVRRWVPAMSHFNRGTDVAVFPFRNHRIAPLICYEDIIVSFTRRAAQKRPHLLVNITNDAWFGLTAAPHQHLALSVYRSVELRLDLVRAVNTGVSALIDATGRVRAQTDVYDPVVQDNVPPITLLKEAALMPAPTTFYAKAGNLFATANLLAALALILWRRRWSRQRRRPLSQAWILR